MKNAGEYIRGHTDTIILSILDRKDSYGYEISKIISNSSDGEFVLTEATFYNAFKRMIKEGLILTYWENGTNNVKRKYYSITKRGKELLKQERKTWQRAQGYLEVLIGGNYEG